MTNTTFNEGNYNYIRFYQDATIEGCTFNEKMGVDVANSVDATVKVTNSTVTNGTVEDLFDSEDVDRCEVYVDDTLLVNPVAKIGDTEYKTLEEAFTNAQDGETITLLSDATPTLISQRAITKAAVIDLGDNTLTLTEDDLYFGTTTFKNGTIVVDKSVKPSTAVFWMFANQTLTFDNVKLIATGVTGTYLIGLDGNNSDLNLINGSEIVVENETALDLDIICVNASTGNDILVENSKVTVKNLDGRVFFRGNYTVSGNSEVNLDGITKAGFRIEAGQTLTISDTANVTITGEPRDGGIHLTDVTAVYTKADTATVTATVNKPVVYVAEVNGVKYADLQEAIKAAAPSGTVELLCDVTVDKWIMFSETLSISNGNIITLSMDGLTINGNGYSLTVNSIESAGNGGRLFYDATNLNIKDLTINYADGVAGGIGLTSGTIENVTFNGGTYAVLPKDGEITITGCTFATNGTAIYFEEERDSLTVTNNTFNQPDNVNVILLRGDVVFTGNTVNSGRTVNVVSGSPVVEDNNFNEVRFKVYNEATAAIEGNTINVLTFNDDSAVQSTFVENTLSEDAQAVLAGATFPFDGANINNLEDLKAFRDSVNNGETYAGKTVTLNVDIDLAGEDWTPIGYMGKTFKGTFDGNNHTVKNLSINKEFANASENNGIGFFGRCDAPAIIKNLTIENADIQGSLYVGAVVGYGYTGKSIENCTVKGKIYIDAWWYAGVIGGNGYMNIIDNCHVIGAEGSDSYIKGNDGSYIGGIWGFRGEGNNKITNCTVTNISITGVDRVGGISGIGHYGNSVENCEVDNVSIQATDPEATTVGLIVGACQGNANSPTIFTGNTVSDTTAKVGDKEVNDLFGTNINGTTAVTNYAASVNGVPYEKLEEAFKAATEGCTIEILSDVTIDYKWDCRDYATNGSHSQFKESVTINGNNHTIKFTDTVSDNNWNTIFRFEENAKVKDLIIDISEATGTQRVITAKKSLDVDNLTIIGSAKYGIIFGEGASAEDLAAAEISVSNSDLYGTRRAISDNEGGKDVKSVTITDNTLNANVCVSASDTVTFTGNTMTAGYVDIRSYTENNTLNVTATGNTLTANTDTIYNEINAGGTVNAQDDFVLPAAPVAKIGDNEYTSLADAAVAAVSGDTITMIADAAEDVTLPAGIIFDGNDKQVGAITAAGEITFKGYTKATNFGVQYTNTTINIGEGACLELTGTGRMVIGHGCTFNITGSITDAKTADTANITPSLIAAGASLTGAGVNFNVTNAYVKFTAYCSSKNSNASGTYNINVTNSIWEQTGSLVFSEPTNSKDPTFNFNVKDSVLNSTSHLVFAVTKGEIVFDNSIVNKDTARQLENRSTLTIKNGSYVNASVATSQNAKNPGTTIVDNATYNTTGELTGSDVGTGTLILKNNANFTTGTISKTNVTVDTTSLLTAKGVNSENTTVTVDATSMEPGEVKVVDLSGTASIENIVTLNGDRVSATFSDDGDVTVTKEAAPATPVAKVGDTEYTSLQAAINNANGATVTLIANTAETISIDDDATVVIDLGGNILTGYIAPCDPVSLTVKNGSIVNTNGDYSAIEINSGKLALENTNIESARHGVRIDGAVEAIINGGEYKLNATSGTRHAVNVSGYATLTIKDGTFIGPKGTTMDSGSAVCVQSGATVIIEDGNFSGGKNATLGVSGTMTIYGGTFDQNPSEYLADGYIARGANGEITTDEYIVCVEDFDIKVLMLWDFDKVQAPDADGTMVDCYPVALFGIINTLNYKEVGFILEFEDPDTKEIKTHNFVTNDAYTSLLVNEDVKNQIGASSTTVTPDMYDGTYFYGDMMNMKAKYADSPLRFRPYAKLLDGTYVYGKARYNIDEITDKDDK